MLHSARERGVSQNFVGAIADRLGGTAEAWWILLQTCATRLQEPEDMLESSNVVGPHFDAAHLAEADRLACEVLRLVGEQLDIGMRSSDVRRLIMQQARSMGAERHWHRPIVRIGSETTLDFRERSAADEALRDNDVCFIDIGPVFLGHEADRGETFVSGDGYVDLAQAARALWLDAAALWRAERWSGRQIYRHVETRARELGYRQLARGHRIGDWPHGRYVRGTLAANHRIPEPNLWVLEVHLIDDARQRGAFHEAPLA